MPSNVQLIEVRSISDGDRSKRPPTTPAWSRNDGFWLEKMGEKYAKEAGATQPGLTYRLDRLPDGFSGWEKSRDKDPGHVDRYVYGHPNGIFRSTNEFFPHLKCLLENGGPAGCECNLCSGRGRGGKKRSSSERELEQGSGSQRSNSPVPEQTQIKLKPFRAPATIPQHQTSGLSSSSQTPRPRGRPPKAGRPPPLAKQVLTNLDKSYAAASPAEVPDAASEYIASLPQGRPPDTPKRSKRDQVDEEGTPDVFRKFFDELKASPLDSILDHGIAQDASPDWRAGNTMLNSLLSDHHARARYLPRGGEIVLFLRNLDDDSLDWQDSKNTYLYSPTAQSATASQKLVWEAGVVTQTPTVDLAKEDLYTSLARPESVTYSGFRVEPLCEVGSADKQLAKQHKYLPLHAIRPFSFWKECMNGVPEDEWHPTIKHAFTVSSSFCLSNLYHFKGQWPAATAFAHGVYIGPEFILTGDVVRLLPKWSSQKKDAVTDVLCVTAIKLVFVNLDDATDDDQDEGPYYNTCLHISGKAYTLDPERSFDRVGKGTARVRSEDLPEGLEGYGQWYHILDPARLNSRLEVPYTRILGRCYEDRAVEAWFASDKPRHVSSNGRNHTNGASPPNLSRGLAATLHARSHSSSKDPRIMREAGKTWYWADTRVEQLDLHEVNGKYVGVKDKTRGFKDMQRWRRALRALEGKKDAIEALQEERAKQAAVAKSRSGLVAGTQIFSEDDDDEEEEDEQEEGEEAQKLLEPQGDAPTDDMEISDSNRRVGKQPAPASAQRGRPEVIDLEDDSSEDEEARADLMHEFAAGGVSRLRNTS